MECFTIKISVDNQSYAPTHTSLAPQLWCQRSQTWKLIQGRKKTNKKKTRKVWLTAGFHYVKLNFKVYVMFHWPTNAAQQQTRRLTESRWGPSGELHVSCCAKLQKNNSSSCCPQRKTEGSGKQQQSCQQGSQCLIIMLNTRNGRITTCPFTVYMLCFGRFIWRCCSIITLPAVNNGSTTETVQRTLFFVIGLQVPVKVPPRYLIHMPCLQSNHPTLDYS